MNIKNLLLNSLTVLTLTLTLAACGGDDDDPFAPVNPVNPGGTQPSDGSNNTNRNSTTTTSEAWRLEFPKLKGGNNLVIVHTAPMPTKADVNFRGVGHQQEVTALVVLSDACLQQRVEHQTVLQHGQPISARP